MTISTISGFRRAMRNGPYASPGGYPCYFLTRAAISFDGAKQERRNILEAIRDKDNSGWRVIALDVNWECELYCDHTGERIESAYGEE